jgi:hypothetical protein
MPSTTYRVLVSTDLGGDPDDIQSLIHLLHYSDILKIEGIVSSPGPGSVNRVEKIREWIERTDLPFLRRRHPQLMSKDEVLAVTRQGALEVGAPAPGKTTAGSEWITARAKADDPLGQDRPLWVLAWGSLTDIAQALHDDPSIAGRIRLYYIGSSNTTADPESRDFVFRFMQEHFPDLWWIENGILPRFQHDTFRGYYLGGDQSGERGAVRFVEETIRGRGTNCGGKFEQILGNAMPMGRHPGSGQDILKEGDTPTFLYLLSPVVGGVGNVDDPTGESWGGQFRHPLPDLHPNYFVDLDAPAEVCHATINKWRVAYLSSWKERWGWYGEQGLVTGDRG